MTDRFAVQHQDRNLEAETPAQFLVGVYVEHANVGGATSAETPELDEHFVAQVAAFARDDREAEQAGSCAQSAGGT